MEAEMILRGSIDLFEVSRSTTAASMEVEVLLRGSINLVEVSRSTSSFSSAASGFSSHFNAEGWCPFKNRHSATSMDVEVLLRGSIDLVEVRRSTSSFSSVASGFSYHLNKEGWCPFKNLNTARSHDVLVPRSHAPASPSTIVPAPEMRFPHTSPWIEIPRRGASISLPVRVRQIVVVAQKFDE